MNIAGLCNRPVVSINVSASLQAAATLMRNQHVGALLLTRGDTDQPQAVGMVTDRDLAIEVLARDPDASDKVVGDISSPQLVTVPAHAGISEAIEAMGKAGVRRLIVVNDDRQVLGLVSSDDLLAALATELSAMVDALRRGIEREVQERPATTLKSKPVFMAYGTPGMA